RPVSSQAGQRIFGSRQMTSHALVPRRHQVSWTTIVAASALALLSACTVGPDFTPPAEPVSEHYDRQAEQQLAAAGGENGAQVIHLGQKIGGDWWLAFGSAKLDRVMQQAIDGNLGLAAAD